MTTFGSQGTVAIFFIRMPQEGFIILCLIWYALDVVSLRHALAQRTAKKADDPQAATNDEQSQAKVQEFKVKTADALKARNLDSLLAALWENEFEIRIQAMKALVELGDSEAVPRLIEFLKNERWDVRLTAAETRGELGDPRAIKALQVALNDENALVKAVAAGSLKKLKTRSGQAGD